jgi:hypothetical protein
MRHPTPDRPDRPTELPRLLDITTLATHLGINARHIRRLVAERRIPYIKVGSPHPLRPRRDRRLDRRQPSARRPSRLIADPALRRGGAYQRRVPALCSAPIGVASIKRSNGEAGLWLRS